MKITCKTCGNIIEDVNSLRCPRCYTLIKEHLKCGDCKGCSLKLKECTKQ